jgi:SNF2 family DNA or RNA helicase
MLQAWYSHEPTLRRLAQALFEAGAYGFHGASTERVFAELCNCSDFDLFQSCVQYGFSRRARAAGAGGGASGSASASAAAALAAEAALPEGETIATLSRSALLERDGVQPFVAPPGLSGARLLQAAARALPAWAHESSAKMAWLKAWLPGELAAGHRVLVFSQLMAVLSIAENCLAAWGVRYLRLDGSTPVAERQALLDDFGRDKGIGVFLLSTKAGGLGLNLVAADTVVIHDSDWNPHADAQAVDRAHRLGQTREVSVFRLLTQGSLDEHMHSVAASKLALDAALNTKDAGPIAAADAAKSRAPSATTIANLLATALA